MIAGSPGQQTSDSTSRDSGGGGGGAGRVRINAGLASLQGTVSPALSTNLATQEPLPLSSTMIAIPRHIDYLVGCDCQSGLGPLALLLLLLLPAALLAPRRASRANKGPFRN